MVVPANPPASIPARDPARPSNSAAAAADGSAGLATVAPVLGPALGRPSPRRPPDGATMAARYFGACRRPVRRPSAAAALRSVVAATDAAQVYGSR